MRIRKKLVVLHTFFSLALAAVLVLALRPAVGQIVREAEGHQARLVADLVGRALGDAGGMPGAGDAAMVLRSRLPDEVTITAGDAGGLGLAGGLAGLLSASAGKVMVVAEGGEPPRVLVGDGRGAFVSVLVELQESRRAVRRLYGIVVVALLAVYGLIAFALEVFILPRHVWRPIAAVLEADQGVRENDRAREIIPERFIPGDELGQIMRSRNATVGAMRDNERRLNEALGQVERIASDLHQKNQLLEAAKRNLADADRLASLGMMSAGLAHELNTPLAVAKGLVEKLAADPVAGLAQGEAELLVRVVGRLERLSESLLDFARARPPSVRPTDVHAVVDEAWTLVRIDREAKRFALGNEITPGTVVPADPDRLLQVLVNLLRNAADAMVAQPGGRIDVRGSVVVREEKPWLSIRVQDTGPGLSPEVIGRLFEPFASTRLDARGTGLGLAVSQGIIREHAGVLTARNRVDGPGAEFEILLPMGGGA
jgi:signal transduction histidine kinase